MRRRLLAVVEGLEAGDWARPSRCELWTVHDVIRHVRDACRLHVDGLRREGVSPLDKPFDPRRTPQEWLDPTTGASPEETVAHLRALCPQEAEALDTRVRRYTDEVVMAPYGPVHWTILTAHVFWDAWLHVRDVTEALGGGFPSTPVEDGVVALYALLIASMPAGRRNHRFDVTVRLTGADAREHVASVVPGRVVLRSGGPAPAADLRGDLVAVVDSLAGRGPPIESVLLGDPARREPLTWLRRILQPAG